MEAVFLQVEELGRESEREYVGQINHFLPRIKEFLEEKHWLADGHTQDILDMEKEKLRIRETPDGTASKLVFIRELEKMIAQIPKALPEDDGTLRYFQQRLERSQNESASKDGASLRGGAEFYLERSDPLVIFRNRVRYQTALAMTITNGAVYYAYDRGLNLGVDDIVTYAATQLQLKEFKGDKTTSMQTISDITSKLGFPLRTMDEYINKPLYPVSFFTTGQRGTFRHRRFWVPLKINENNDFIIATESNSSSLLMSLPAKINDHFHDHSSFDSTEYLFLGELVGAGRGGLYHQDFPLKNQNDKILVKAAAMAKSEEGKIFFGAFEEDNPYLILSGNFAPVPAYSLALKRNVHQDFHGLKEDLNLLYYALVFSFTLLLLISAMVSKWVTRPLHQLLLGLGRIKAGNLTEEVAVPGRDEFRDLASGFNSMLYYLREKERITSFLSAGTADQIVSSEGQSTREEACILFVGILDISTAQEDDSDLWDSFISIVHKSILENGGIIDKFNGTACLGLFYADQIREFPILAAAELKKRFEDWNQKREKPCKIGIGLATGDVVLGHVGSSDRKDFTCIGNTVNMAARLETLGLESSQDITIYLCQRTKELIPRGDQYSYRKLDPVQIKGLRDLQEVYEFLL